MDKQALKRLSAEVEKENLLFAHKMFLDNLTLPSEIIGRERKAKELVGSRTLMWPGSLMPFASTFAHHES